MKTERALAIAAQARVRRRVSSDPSAPYSTGATASFERPVPLRDGRGRFLENHARPGAAATRLSQEAFTSYPFLRLPCRLETARQRAHCANFAKSTQQHICGSFCWPRD